MILPPRPAIIVVITRYSCLLSLLSLSLLVSMAGVLGVVVSNGDLSLQGNSLLDLGTPNAFSTAIKPPLLSSSSSSPRVPSTGPVAGSDGGSFLSETSLPINGRYCIFLYYNKFWKLAFFTKIFTRALTQFKNRFTFKTVTGYLWMPQDIFGFLLNFLSDAVWLFMD